MKLAILSAALLFTLTACGPKILQTAPEPGTLPYKDVVFVDDGSCPAGQVAQHTGGSNRLGINRKVECVARPQ